MCNINNSNNKIDITVIHNNFISDSNNNINEEINNNSLVLQKQSISALIIKIYPYCRTEYFNTKFLEMILISIIKDAKIFILLGENFTYQLIFNRPMRLPKNSSFCLFNISEKVAVITVKYE